MGLQDMRLFEKLQLDPELTLENTVTQVWQAKYSAKTFFLESTYLTG